MGGYQSVDVAASDFQSPKAISGKGAGAERAIDEAQGSLFALPEWEPDTHVEVPINSGLWHFCVSVAGEDVRSEEHTPELQSLMRTSSADFCLRKKTSQNTTRTS